MITEAYITGTKNIMTVENSANDHRIRYGELKFKCIGCGINLIGYKLGVPDNENSFGHERHPHFRRKSGEYHRLDCRYATLDNKKIDRSEKRNSSLKNLVKVHRDKNILNRKVFFDNRLINVDESINLSNIKLEEFEKLGDKKRVYYGNAVVKREEGKKENKIFFSYNTYFFTDNIKKEIGGVNFSLWRSQFLNNLTNKHYMLWIDKKGNETKLDKQRYLVYIYADFKINKNKNGNKYIVFKTKTSSEYAILFLEI